MVLSKVKLWLVLLFGLCALKASATTILVLGDSISAAYRIPKEQGWVSLLQQRLDSDHPNRYQVINGSVSGDTTAQGLRRLPSLLEAHEPDKLVVELGGNDGLRGLPLSHMRDNLQAIIDLGKEAGADVILLGVALPASHGMVFNERYLAVFDSLAEINGLERVILGYDLLDDPSLIQDDGIHPTAEAQPLLLEALWPVLMK